MLTHTDINTDTHHRHACDTRKHLLNLARDTQRIDMAARVRSLVKLLLIRVLLYVHSSVHNQMIHTRQQFSCEITACRACLWKAIVHQFLADQQSLVWVQERTRSK